MEDTMAMKYYDMLAEAIRKKVKAIKAYFDYVDYQVMEVHNPLTEEIIYYIEYKKHWHRKPRIYKIRNKINQKVFGCDKDGMFGNYQNCLKIKMFISGELKEVRRPAIKPKAE